MPALPPRSASLTPFFTPKGVAVIGASRDPSKLSYGVMSNLTHPQHGFRGPVYPVNPNATEIMGRRCYPDIASVPDPVDLAVIVLPAPLVCQTVEACGKRGLKAAVIISGGFREIGPPGAALEEELVTIARRYGIRLMGPNCIGVIDTHTPLDTTFVAGVPPQGHIAFLSQSGALCGAIIDWTIGQGIGFSRLLSVGNEADVNETDVLPFLADDETSHVITLYLEDVKGGPAFVEALRQAARRKPVLALKAGRTASGQTATASHTGALAGAHAAFRAACRQTGVIEVENSQDLFNGALALAYQPTPAGNRVAIVTNAGGPAALAADVFEAHGLRLARISPETQAILRTFLPANAQVAGPVDMLGNTDHEGYLKALSAVFADPANDAVLAMMVPHLLVSPVAVVEAFATAAATARPRKPIVACLMGEASLAGAYKAAHDYKIPAYTFPEDAVTALALLYQRGRWLATPHPAPQAPPGCNRQLVQSLLATAQAAGRRTLDAAESGAVLAAYGIATPPDIVATTADEAASAARQIGFPVALKLVSPDILHKTDVGGVLLNINDAAAAQAGFATIVQRARRAYPHALIRGVQVQPMVGGGQEVIVGVRRDPTFGPLVMFGLGGIYVEALADVSFRLAPLTAGDAGEMIDEVRSARLLSGLRGARPADRLALGDAIVRIGQLAADCPQIKELDVNPLIVRAEGQGAVAVDARIIL